MSAETGDTRIVIYLGNVTEAQIETIMDACATACAKAGLGVSGDDSDVAALVALSPAPFPDLADEAAVRAFLEGHARFTIPCADGFSLTEVEG